MLERIDLNLLRILVAVVEERSTVRAAERLMLSQPTISGALGRLREELGDELLVRAGRRLEPTARALELVETIRPLLDGLAAAVAEVMPFNPAKDARVFRLGCTDAVALAALPSLSRRLRQDAPNCNLVVRVGDYRLLPGMLASGEITTAIAYLRNDPPATAKIRVLRRSPWVVLRDATSPPLDGLGDFCARPHALVTPLGDLAGFVDDALAALDRRRRVAIGVSSFSLLLSVLPGSDLLATVPDFVAERLASFGQLVMEACPVAIPPVKNTLAWRAAADKDPSERWFRQQLCASFAPDPAETEKS